MRRKENNAPLEGYLIHMRVGAVKELRGAMGGAGARYVLRVEETRD